ncbi:DUF4064 domain-containing protein [Pseudogracilibacillus sp. SE30717A]|uniref:DUF4064 domain-containing protein n=1 Tax=Pseudogracilibacillus sp. SE30717A TaxID=3098293 RepID=UPI00300E601A
MKRTGEITLIIIGAVLNLLGIIGFGLFTSFSQTDFFLYNVLDGYGSPEELFVINIMTGIGWFLAILSFFALIAGIIALFFFKGNKKPKPASIILIITSVIVLLGTFGMGFFAFLCYLVAGIMGLVRKPPHVEVEEAVTDPSVDL